MKGLKFFYPPYPSLYTGWEVWFGTFGRLGCVCHYTTCPILLRQVPSYENWLNSWRNFLRKVNKTKRRTKMCPAVFGQVIKHLFFQKMQAPSISKATTRKRDAIAIVARSASCGMRVQNSSPKIHSGRSLGQEEMPAAQDETVDSGQRVALRTRFEARLWQQDQLRFRISFTYCPLLNTSSVYQHWFHLHDLAKVTA